MNKLNFEDFHNTKFHSRTFNIPIVYQDPEKGTSGKTKRTYSGNEYYSSDVMMWVRKKIRIKPSFDIFLLFWINKLSTTISILHNLNLFFLFANVDGLYFSIVQAKVCI